MKRGRDNALAKAIAAKLGENATMQALKGEVGQDKAKVIEIFSNNNPDLNWIPLENMLQMFGKITDQGLDAKLSEDIESKVSAETYKQFAANQDSFIKALVDIAKNQGIPKDDTERKALLKSLVDGNYPDLKQKGAIVNYFNKILRPYAKQTTKYKAVKIDLETYINEVLVDDTVDRYADFYGLKNGAKIFADEAVTNQRPFVKLLANIAKAKYKNPLNLAAKFWHYKAMLEDGLIDNSKKLGILFHQKLNHIKDKYPNYLKYIFPLPLYLITKNLIIYPYYLILHYKPLYIHYLY